MQNCWVPGPFFLEKQTGRGVGRDAERGNGVEGESWRSVRSLPNKCWEAADRLKSVRPAVLRRQQGKDRAEGAPVRPAVLRRQQGKDKSREGTRGLRWWGRERCSERKKKVNGVQKYSHLFAFSISHRGPP